jgi:hypothetical protein
MTECSTLEELAAHLAALTDAVAARAAAMNGGEWRRPYAPGKWTRAEALGHLVDSAAHNHQRFARALHAESLTANGYDGAAQVRAQRYSLAPIVLLTASWAAQNRLLSFVLTQVPPAKEETPCIVASAPPMTLRELAFDYVAHLEHHLRQIFGHESIEYSGLPWPPAGRWQ